MMGWINFLLLKRPEQESDSQLLELCVYPVIEIWKIRYSSNFFSLNLHGQRKRQE